MDYQEAWTVLDNLQFFKIKLGLESMTRFLADLDGPHRGLRFIHVAGTNGKGSVSATLLAILARAGYRVGLYTSPHLNSVRERFRINDAYISRHEFAKHATRIHAILNGRLITYFEFTTALAMLWFAEQETDLVILEVGMGGRLDATNVITPLVGIITNVSMDHEAYLGRTLEAVAREKAGIIKPGVPVVAGVAADASRRVIEETCQRQGAALKLLGRDFLALPAADGRWSYQGIGGRLLGDLSCSLRGAHQLINAALALAALEITAEQAHPVDDQIIRTGLREVRWPGRLELLEGPPVAGAGQRHGRRIRYLLDGAHNPAGVKALLAALGSEFRYERLIMVWASMADKDLSSMLAAVAPVCQRLLFTRLAGERAAEPARLAALLTEEDRVRAECLPDIPSALARASELAGPGDLICVAGSLYLIGAARKILLGELVDDE